MNTPVSHDAGYLSLARPLLRGPDGDSWIVQPGALAGSVRAQRLTSRDGEVLWCYGHGNGHDPLPWLATEREIHALLGGDRPLRIAPSEPWGGPSRAAEAPYASVVQVEAAGSD